MAYGINHTHCFRLNVSMCKATGRRGGGLCSSQKAGCGHTSPKRRGRLHDSVSLAGVSLREAAVFRRTENVGIGQPQTF